MKKGVFITICVGLLVSSCGTYMGSGAYMGSSIGMILGSAVGGLSDGPRGSDIGTIVGMAGGAVIGSVIGAKIDQRRHEDYALYEQNRRQRMEQRRGGIAPRRHEAHGLQGQETDESGFDPENGGDDRIDSSFFENDDKNQGETGLYSTTADDWPNPHESIHSKANRIKQPLQIRNIRFLDEDDDGEICAGENCSIAFEVMNRSRQVIANVEPFVEELRGNKNILVSPAVNIERVAPGSGIRYTAMVKATGRLKNGTADFVVSVRQNGYETGEKILIQIPTKRRCSKNRN